MSCDVTSVLKNMRKPNQHFGYLSLLEIFDSGDDYFFDDLYVLDMEWLLSHILVILVAQTLVSFFEHPVLLSSLIFEK